MKRSLVFALLLSIGHAPVAMAGRGPHDADVASWGGASKGNMPALSVTNGDRSSVHHRIHHRRVRLVTRRRLDRTPLL